MIIQTTGHTASLHRYECTWSRSYTLTIRQARRAVPLFYAIECHLDSFITGKMELLEDINDYVSCLPRIPSSHSASRCLRWAISTTCLLSRSDIVVDLWKNPARQGGRKAFSFEPVIKTPFNLLKHLAVWQLQKFNKKSKGGPNGRRKELSAHPMEL